MLPLEGIEPGPLISSNSKSNTILSGLTWHDLQTSVHAPLDFRTWMIQLKSIEHDYI